MKKVQSSVSYQTKNYKFDFDTSSDGTVMYVFDLDHNLLLSLEGLENIKNICIELQEVLKTVLKEEECSACACYQSERVAKTCPKHQIGGLT